MIISDEQLSAFLDAELSATEMEMIRERLCEDDNLTNRLAELAMVDELVRESYSHIDAQSLPEKITRLLSDEQLPTVQREGQVIVFPLWKRIQRSVQQPVTIAASIFLLLGIGITQLIQHNNTDNNWNAVAQILETTPSGIESVASNNAVIKPQITFKNQQGDYCRQYQLKSKQGDSENIACRIDEHWKAVTSVAVEHRNQENEYQTATGGSVLDSEIEQMAAGDFLNAHAESALINQHWRKP